MVGAASARYRRKHVEHRVTAVCSDPLHRLPDRPAARGTDQGGDGLSRVPVCDVHHGRIGQGEPWLWVPWQRLKGASSDLSEGCILMGEELAGYGLVVDVDVRMSNSLVFSADLVDGRETTTLAIDGRVFGVNQPVSLELVLAPETVARLERGAAFRAALRIGCRATAGPPGSASRRCSVGSSRRRRGW